MERYFSGAAAQNNCDKLRHTDANPLTRGSARVAHKSLRFSDDIRLRTRSALVLLPLLVRRCRAEGGSSRPAPSNPSRSGCRPDSPTGNFRPFSEALVKGYAQADARRARRDRRHARDRYDNIEALQDGTVDIGLSQAGIAYMAYNGRLRESGRPLRNIRGIAILNSSAVHLLVGPGSPIRSMDELRGRRVGVGPDGSGAAVDLSNGAARLFLAG